MPIRSATPQFRFASAALFAVLLALVPVLSVFAQSGTAEDPYESELLGWDISVTGPNYVLENVALEEYPHGQGERVYVTSVDSLGFVEIAFFDDADSAEQSIEIMLRDFESASTSFAVIESGSEDGLYYALSRFEIDHALTGYCYIEIAQDLDGNVDVAQSIYSLNSNFLDQLSLAQQEIDLNGMPFLANPVLNLPMLLANDAALLASTPQPVATPRIGEFGYQSGAARLEVNTPIEYDFAVSNQSLDVKFLKSENGFAVIGYIHQQSDSAEPVIASVFEGAPSDDSAPDELFLETDQDHAFGVYRVASQGTTRIMVIDVQRSDSDLWIVQAVAIEESAFEGEFGIWQSSVIFNDQSFLNGIVIDDIISILEENVD